jgi:5'-methylthioadenosine phosphorylase
VIGMTAMPEARLAREAEVCYATLAMVTDYDVWHDCEDDVSVEVVLSNLEANRQAVERVLTSLAEAGLPRRSCACASVIERAIVTAPSRIPRDVRDRLSLLLPGRLLAE